MEGVSILEVSARIIVVLVVWECITVVLQFVGPTLSGPSQFVGPGFGSTLVLAEILILRKIIKYVRGGWGMGGRRHNLPKT